MRGLRSVVLLLTLALTACGGSGGSFDYQGTWAQTKAMDTCDGTTSTVADSRYTLTITPSGGSLTVSVAQPGGPCVLHFSASAQAGGVGGYSAQPGQSCTDPTSGQMLSVASWDLFPGPDGTLADSLAASSTGGAASCASYSEHDEFSLVSR